MCNEAGGDDIVRSEEENQRESESGEDICVK